MQVKVLRYEKDIMRAEVDMLRLVRAQTDVPVPGSVRLRHIAPLIDNEYYLMAFIPGVGMFKLRS